tara:strand:+ start:89 stop:868 length:780 start_codon:yes stop_codon:yes gene_type:complete
MPKFVCECCQYETTRKSSYTDHLLSKKHIANNAIQVANTVVKISNPVVEVVKNVFNLDTYLNETCKDAMNFDFFVNEFLFEPEHQDDFFYVTKGDDELCLLRKLEYMKYPSSISYASSIFCKTFNKLEHFQKPIFCSNVKVSKFHIKQNDKWTIIDEYELGEKVFNIVLKKLTRALHQMKNLSPKQFKQVYNIDKYSWLNTNETQLVVIIYGIDKDKFISFFCSELSKLCNRKQVKYTCPTNHSWCEFDEDIIEDSEDE